MMYTSIVL